MLGQSTLGIGMTLFLRDQFTGPAAKIRASAGMMSADFRKMQEESLRHQRNLHAGLAMAGIAAMGGMARGIKTAAKFSYEMEFVKSITQATVKEQKQLRATAKDLAGKTMFFPKELGEGMRFMAMAGMEVPQIMENITGAVNLAGSTMANLGGKGGAADIMTNVMKQFQVDFKYSTNVADQLSYAVTRSNTNLFDLGEALKYAGSTSMDLNIPLQESIAMVMALGNAGIQGSMAGTAMENSMRYMSRAFSSFGSGTSKKALEMIGLTPDDVTDAAGNLISMTEIMKKFGQAIDENFGGGMNLEKQAILQSIFGVRGKRAGSLLIRNLKEFDRFTTDISTKSGGHAGGIMGDMMVTLQGELLKFTSQWQNMWESFTIAIEPFLKVAVQALRGIGWVLTKVFDHKWIGAFFATGVSGWLVFKTASSAYRAVATGIRLIHLQMGTAFASTTSSTVSGYASMTAAAVAYSNTVKVGALAGYSSYGMMAHAAGRGKMRGLTTNAAGRIVSKTGTKFVSGAAAAGVLSGAGRMVAGKYVARTATKMALGKIVGFLGGPVGIALSFILPGLISMAIRAIKGNKEETEKNTKALQDQRRNIATGSVQYTHAVRFLDDYRPKLMALQAMGVKGVTEVQLRQTEKESYLQNLIDSLERRGYAGGSDIIINIDGEEISRVVKNQVDREFMKNGL